MIKKATEKKEKSNEKLIAKRDFLIEQNDVFIEIKEGDDLEAIKIPERFFANLQTENVI